MVFGMLNCVNESAGGLQTPFVLCESKLLGVLNVFHRSLYSCGKSFGEYFEETFKKREPTVAVWVEAVLPRLQYEDDQPMEEEGVYLRHLIVKEYRVSKVN